MDRREARRAAARLRALGRQVPLERSDQERLRQAQQAVRTEDTYQAAATCPNCAHARQEAGNPTALCPVHLADALGC